MAYLNTATSEYPRHIGDLMLLGWSEGEPLPEGWVEVFETPAPVAEAGWVVYENTPKKTKDGYVQDWATRELTPAEVFNRRKMIAVSKVARGIGLDADEAALLVF